MDNTSDFLKMIREQVQSKTSNHQKDNIDYVPLDPVCDYVYIADLNTRLRVVWKMLPNLNFKLKFQTQTWI